MLTRCGRRGKSQAKGLGFVSGGIAAIPLQRDYYYNIASDRRVRSVCEVGFNVGHSTAVWLLSHPETTVINFDLQAYSFGRVAAAVLERRAA